MKRENWINKLAAESLKANRVRNIMVILSVAVISMVITTAFNAAISVVVSAEQQLTNQIGTTAQCSINKPTEAQLKKLYRLPYITSVGYEINSGEAYYNNHRLQLVSISKEEWSKNRRPTVIAFHGEMPEGADEIALSQSLLQSLDIQKPYLGKEITLSCSLSGDNGSDTLNKTFRIAGWYRDQMQYDIKSQGILYVSDKFAAESGKTVANDGSAYFSFKKNPLMREMGIIRSVFSEPKIEGPSQKQISQLKKELPAMDNQQVQKVYRGFKYVYNAQRLEPYLIIIIPVIICGFLLIFDCFYLSIFRDLRECGLLMTVGASLKQLNSILRRQALVLAVTGIIAGIPLSLLALRFAVPVYMTRIVGEKACFVWTISAFFLAALFTYAVVAISAQAVNIYLGRASVVDLLRCENAKKKKSFFGSFFANIRRARNKDEKGNNVYRLAASNVMRNAKVNFHVLLSLFIAVTVFLLINVVISGINPKQFAADQLAGHDFMLTNKTFYYNYVDPYHQDGVGLQKVVFDDAFVTGLKQGEGVKKVRTIGYLPIALRTDLNVLGRFLEHFNEESGTNNHFKQDGYHLGDLWVVDEDYLLNSLNKTQKSQIDLKTFKSGDTVFIDSDEPNLFPENFIMDGYVLNSGQADQLNLSNQTEVSGSLFHGNENSFTFRKGGFCKPRFSEDISYRAIPPSLFISGAGAKDFSSRPIIVEISIDTDKAYRFSMERYLEETVGDNPLIDFKSREQLIENMEGTKNAVYLLGYMLSAIVMLIGLLGFINMTVINTELRKGEFAILRSIGMTRKQLLAMLMAEGIYNAAILILSTITIGNFMVYKLYSIFGYGEYSFPLVPLVGVSLFITGLLAMIPLMVYSSERKKSISVMLQEIN